MPSACTLISFASRQIWPQVLSVLHQRPARLRLFHSAEGAESKRPAQRLRELLASSQILPPGAILLREVPHDRFQEIVDALADAAAQDSLDDTNSIVNLTGGNKLMALAAAEWCRLAGVPCFYLERDLRVFPFLPKGGDLLPQPDYQLDPHLARDLDPLALLGCQLDNAQIVSPGQRLVLNEPGRQVDLDQFPALLQQHRDFREFLAWDHPAPEERYGDGLEFAVAFALLKLGVPAVQRGIRLSPRVPFSSALEEGELDLVFNWSGKLWLVDCKDRKSPESRINALRSDLQKDTPLSPQIQQHLDCLAEELRQKELHPLKEDLLAVSETAGLLGRAICVRRSPLPPQANEFARSRNLPVVLKHNLLGGLRPLLFPDAPASLDELKALAKAKTSALP